MRVGGPYRVSATLTGFSPEVVNDLTMNLGVTQDLQFTLKVAALDGAYFNDVRQGNFVGAGVNTVTRSGTNTFSGSVYRRFSNEDFVGTEAKGLVVDPGTFNTTNTGFWVGGPAIKNTLFGFMSFEKQRDTRPLTLFRANKGNEPAGGSVTRVLASDMDGATTVSVFWEGRTNGNTSYLFATDMNGDTGINDAIYIPRHTSEMNFQQFSAPNGRIFTAGEQAQAWEAYINQDSYLSTHRGEYAERFAVFLPLVTRMDLSVMQDVFHSVKGMRHSGRVRLDFINFGNLLNHNWGVGQRSIRNQILTNGGVDANGAAIYRMVLVNNEMLTRSLETTTFLTDVYQVMVSFRYSFQ